MHWNKLRNTKEKKKTKKKTEKWKKIVRWINGYFQISTPGMTRSSESVYSKIK